METYDNEHEQVEALKAWWDTYGTRVIIAIVIVLAGVLGWRYWLDAKNREGEAASEQYMKMLEVIQSKPEQALELGRQLVSAHSGSSYGGGLVPPPDAQVKTPSAGRQRRCAQAWDCP